VWPGKQHAEGELVHQEKKKPAGQEKTYDTVPTPPT